MASRVDVVHLHPGIGVVAPGDTAFAAGLSEEHLSLFLAEEPELGNLVWFFDGVAVLIEYETAHFGDQERK